MQGAAGQREEINIPLEPAGVVGGDNTHSEVAQAFAVKLWLMMQRDIEALKGSIDTARVGQTDVDVLKTWLEALKTGPETSFSESAPVMTQAGIVALVQAVLAECARMRETASEETIQTYKLQALSAIEFGLDIQHGQWTVNKYFTQDDTGQSLPATIDVSVASTLNVVCLASMSAHVPGYHQLETGSGSPTPERL